MLMLLALLPTDALAIRCVSRFVVGGACFVAASVLRLAAVALSGARGADACPNPRGNADDDEDTPPVGYCATRAALW
jgi:hypothetical protein